MFKNKNETDKAGELGKEERVNSLLSSTDNL